MSKELIRLPREVAKAIETVISRGLSSSEIVEYHATGKGKWDISYLNVLELDVLIRALYIGYEIEETPEDKVREYYQHQKAAVVNEHNYDKPTTAIRYVLECLNIKIDGVW